MTGEHVDKRTLEAFRGNVLLASLNQLKYHTTSRRDDIISLFYMLVYLLKKGVMPGIQTAAYSDDPRAEFQHIKEVRQGQKLKDMCYGNTKCLQFFMKEVFSYRFKDMPDYDKLRCMLTELRDQESISL